MRNDRQLKQVISRIVPAASLAHIEFCRLEDGRLRVTVASSAWISRLRFMERQIIGALRARQIDCHSVSYHVAPAEKPTVRKTIRVAKKPTKGADIVEGAADAVSDSGDDCLRQELLKLARTLRSNDH